MCVVREGLCLKVIRDENHGNLRRACLKMAPTERKAGPSLGRAGADSEKKRESRDLAPELVY